MNKQKTKVLQAYMELATQNGFGFANIFGGIPSTEPPYPHERLGDGYELRKIDMVDEKGDPVENRDSYSHLYHNDLKVSDLVFRKGGLGGDFKDGYCSLILYTQKRPHEEKSHGFDFGVHVIINKLGDVCLSGTGMSSYPSHCGGNLGKLKDTYYNLCTGEEVITCSSSGASIDGQRFMIVEHRYDWYNKSLPLGIYRIDKSTCEFEKIDEAKK
jgi:hypothetical protein